MIPANTEVTCPVCDADFTIAYDVYDRESTKCTECDAILELVNGDLEVIDEDIYDEEDEEDETEEEAEEIDPNEGIK